MKNILFLFLTISLFTFTSCDDDSGMVTEPELITTVTLNFTPEPSEPIISFSIRDTDGPGGDAPVAETIQLSANQLYTFTAKFLDESNASDIEDITLEVQEEAAEHLVCYTATGAMVALTTTDTDSGGQPLGLNGTFTTGDAGTGTLKVILKHEPDKNTSDPCATGETDVEVTFDVEIQ